MPTQNVLAIVGESMTQLGPWRLVHWWLIATIVGSAGWVAAGEPGHRIWRRPRQARQRRRLVADRDLTWLGWHWFTGGPLEPRRSFPELDDTGTPTARTARRAIVGAARGIVPVGIMCAEYIRSGAPYGTAPGAIIAAGTIGTGLLAAATVGIVHVTMRAAHFLLWVRPLHYAVHIQAGWKRRDDEREIRPGRYIKVPRERSENTRITVGVHREFPLIDAAEKRVEAIVRAKLALNDGWSAKWIPEGKRAHLALWPKEKMPERAMLADPLVRNLVAAAKESAPLIGLTRGNKPVKVDLDSESPHMLLSASTGGGKSATMRTVVAQLMRDGAHVTVVDVKRHSHRWLRGLPGVTYARDVGEIHKVLVDLGAEGHSRNRALDDVPDGEKDPWFRRHVILCEELNATMSVLKQWWKNHKEPGDQPDSPAVRSLAQILFMGRAVRIHVLAVAQMATARDMGGPEMRENYATRILARHTKNAWNMLVPECEFQPASRHPGRAWVCIGGRATETQVVFMTEAEARAWVLDSDSLELPAADGVADVARREMPVYQGEQAVTVAADPRDGVTPVSLRQAANEPDDDRSLGVVALRYDALRQAAGRDPEFPEPVGRRGGTRVFDPGALQRWEANRPSSVTTGEVVDEVDTDTVGDDEVVQAGVGN